MRNILTNQSIGTMNSNTAVERIVTRNNTESCEGTVYFKNGIRIQYNVERILSGYLFSYTLNDDENYSFELNTQKECSLELLNFIDNNMVRLSEAEDSVAIVIEKHSTDSYIIDRQPLNVVNINTIENCNKSQERFEVVTTDDKFYIIDRNLNSDNFNNIRLERRILSDERPDTIYEQRISFIKQFLYTRNFIELDKALNIANRDTNTQNIYLNAYRDGNKIAYITYLQRLLKYHKAEYLEHRVVAISCKIQSLKNEAI